MWIGLFVAGAMLLAASGVQTLADEPAAAASVPTTSSDWPQWRGPNRNGIAPASPKLLDAWPKDGPPLLWKSEPIPTGKYGQEGGSGSPVVADGSVFMFINSHCENGKVVLTTKDLVELGWAEGVPDDLAKKIAKNSLAWHWKRTPRNS
jgi:hypothetical protein